MPKKPSAGPFHKKILQWYSVHQRPLPWRATTNPYRILLSEIMAQQTQVSRVAEYYQRWLRKFPTLTSLANAQKADILREWSGLGYNSRALRFHQLAKIVTQHFRSRLPDDPAELEKLPGIGRYTAHAVSCFAFGKRLPVVDVNIRRVLTRWTIKVKTAADQLREDDAWQTASLFLPRNNSCRWNQSLMDFGAMVCTARQPNCRECPVSSFCRSAFSPSFAMPHPKKTKNEPSWKGIPRRLHRGKILKLLHFQSFSAEEIAEELWNSRSQQDIAWISSLLDTMHREGLLSQKKQKFFLAS